MADLAVDLEVMGSQSSMASSVPKAGRGAVQAAAAVQHNVMPTGASAGVRKCVGRCSACGHNVLQG